MPAGRWRYDAIMTERIRNTAHERLRLLCDGGARLDIAEAALLFSAARRELSDFDSYRGLLALLVDNARTRFARAPLREALAGAVAEDFGFTGDSTTYDDLQNADFARVLERRKGLPVALGIVYIHVARALGEQAAGLNFPGHFLIRVGDGRERAILDPFHAGRACEAADLRELVQSVRGEEAELSPEHLREVSDTEVLLRLQNNVKLRLLKRDDMVGAIGALETMLAIAPDRAELWFESGVLAAQVERPTAAIAALERFMALADGNAAAEEARYGAAALLQKLRQRLN
jgi:regulator of sirC expression with transglutaminase-like and TPR domain